MRKVTVVLAPHNATRWSRVSAPLILNFGFGWGWVGIFTLVSRYPRGKRPRSPLRRRLGWLQSRVDVPAGKRTAVPRRYSP